MQLLALHGHPARRWEPKRLRLRLFSTAGRLARTGRRVLLRLGGHPTWTQLAIDGITRLRALAVPG